MPGRFAACDDDAVRVAQLDDAPAPCPGRPHDNGERLVEPVVGQAVLEGEPQQREAVLATPRMLDPGAGPLAHVW